MEGIKPLFHPLLAGFVLILRVVTSSWESSLGPERLPGVVTQAKYRPRNQTVGLLWRSAAIILQAPSLFYAWISAPESTNRWLLVLCAHERHVRAVKWCLSVSRGMAACGWVHQDACLRLWIHHEMFLQAIPSHSFLNVLTESMSRTAQRTEKLTDMFEKVKIILYSKITYCS